MTDTHQLGALRSPLDERDYVVETIYPPVQEVALPKTLDYRSELPPVRNQGAQGSCAAYAGACMKEWQEQLPMSAQFIYNCRANQSTTGMDARDVMKILIRRGCCTEATYPADSKGIPTIKAYQEAEKYRIKGYAQVNTLDNLKIALHKNGPCYIVFPCYHRGSNLWKPAFKGQKSVGGGHAMTVVGYNRKGFIIRNSWGADWNGDGYTIYPYQEFGMHWEIWTTIDGSSDKPELRRCICG